MCCDVLLTETCRDTVAEILLIAHLTRANPNPDELCWLALVDITDAIQAFQSSTKHLQLLINSFASFAREVKISLLPPISSLKEKKVILHVFLLNNYNSR